MELLVYTQATVFLPFFCLQAAMFAYSNSLSFPVPLEKSVVYQFVPRTPCFLMCSSRQMQCVLFLIRGADICYTPKKIQACFKCSYCYASGPVCLGTLGCTKMICKQYT